MRPLLLLSLGLAACRIDPEPPPLPARPAPRPSAAASAPQVELWPPAAAGLAAPVLHLRVALDAGRLVAPSTVALLRGEVSDSTLRALREGGLPASARQRAVPLRVESAPGELRIFPAAALERGASYTLAVGPVALRHELIVDETAPPILPRLWPPPGEAASSGLAVFCAAAPLPSPLAPVGLPLPGLAAQPGAPGQPDLASCLTLSVEPSGDAWLWPAGLASPDGLALLLSPGPLPRGERPAAPPPACTSAEIALGPGCALVLDDRAVWRLPTEPWLLLRTGEAPRALGSGLALLRGLAPSSEIALEAWLLDLRGELHHASATASTRPPAAHVELSEALADPEGPEPAGEWIELHNDGSAPALLEGWSLEDGQGTMPLPGATLKPGAHALLVNEGFTVAIPPGCAVMRVPKLAKGGLSNQGEPLALRDAQGTIVSRLPASPRPRPGLSLIRTAPGALDADPASFALSTSPTPCKPNAP